MAEREEYALLMHDVRGRYKATFMLLHRFLNDNRIRTDKHDFFVTTLEIFIENNKFTNIEVDELLIILERYRASHMTEPEETKRWFIKIRNSSKCMTKKIEINEKIKVCTLPLAEQRKLHLKKRAKSIDAERKRRKSIKRSTSKLYVSMINVKSPITTEAARSEIEANDSLNGIRRPLSKHYSERSKAIQVLRNSKENMEESEKDLSTEWIRTTPSLRSERKRIVRITQQISQSKNITIK